MTKELVKGAYGCLLAVSNKLSKGEQQDALKKATLAMDFLRQAGFPELAQEAEVIVRDLQAGKVFDVQKLSSELAGKVAKLIGEEGQDAKVHKAHIQVIKVIKCQSCFKECPETANFCSSCGKPLRRPVCPSCRHLNNPGAKFCRMCGAKL